jgi:hypothetical protein
MGQDPGTESAAVTGDERDPEQIQHEIEQTREQLGDTVEALAQKANVKARTRQKIQDAKATVSEKSEQLRGKATAASPDSATTAASQATQTAKENPIPFAALGAFAAGFLAGRFTKR